MTYYDVESYFRAKAVQKSMTTTSAHVFNQCRLLLIKSMVTKQQGDCVFVPIRNLQFQAVLTEDEVIFIDAQGGYALNHRGEGGRMITLAWQWQAQSRDSLSTPVSLQLTFYRPQLADLQRQLLSSFPLALQAKLDALDHQNNKPNRCRILPFRAPD